MKKKLSFSSFMGGLQIRFLIWRRGELKGQDELGNRYFEEKKARTGMQKRRWVLFDGEPDASLVPPKWHAWLHFTSKEPLDVDAIDKDWMKPHQPNLSGSVDAYYPPGHVLAGGQREKATGDYQAWKPE